MNIKIYKILLLALVIQLLLGCGGGVKPTVFLHPDFNFSFIEKIAVVPFENLSKDQGAAYRTTRLFTSELFSTEAFEVTEPGEVKRVVEKFGTVRTAEFPKESIISIGKELGVQAIFFGSVNESSIQRNGTSSNAVVTLIIRLVETETGATIWSATHTQTGKSFLGSVFGAGDKSMSEVTRKCVKNTINTLVK